jgi:hypothetical protein
MNKKDYISNLFRKILKEDLEEKAESLMNKLNYDETLKLNKNKEFDYVQEEKSMCNECGGMMTEGECSECGWKGSSEVMELGGMDDGHPRFGNKNLSKMSRREKDMLMGDRDYEDSFEDDIDYGNTKYGLGDDDDEEDYKDRSMYDPYYGDDEEEYYPELRISSDMPSYKTKYRHSDDEEITEKLYGKQKNIDKNRNNRIDAEDFKMLRKQQDEEQLYEIEFEKEVEEGNEFSGELAKARKEGEKTFKVNGKTYPVRESYLTEKWKGDVEVKQTGEYSDMSIEELNDAIKKQKAKNDKVKDAGKKVSHADRTKMSQLYFAKRAKQGWKGKGKAKVKESILYTESDLIDLIEGIVNEENKKFSVKEPKGYKEYEKVHKADKKENEDYLKLVTKKMTDYLKGMSDEGSKYEMKETKKFPTENGGLKKGNRKKYTPSDAVDEYIDAFSYPGQTNLVFDEIKPNDDKIEKYLKGHSTTGNGVVDKDGNALGNVVPSNTGEKFFKNYQENLYGQEQQNASYKRQPQPVDQAGEQTESGSLKSKRGKKTSKSVLNKLEENVNEKESKKLNEEFDRIQNLMGYNRKTQ